MGSDDAKRLILARRARFVAAAIASVASVASVAACSGDPTPCLALPLVRDPVPPDGGSDADATIDSGSDATVDSGSP